MVDVGAGDVVRSLEGHAAVSMGGTDDRWILIQLNTFTNWVNEQLRTLDMSVENLQTDLCDGKKLCALMQQLQGGKRIGRVMKKPMNQHHYLENVSIALRAMQNDNIRLVNIGSEDIVNGNMKLIMGVIWHLILRYQIGKSKLAPKKLMLAWLSAVIPQCNITNFHHDWNDGIALSALLEYCKPGLFPDWQKLSRRDGLNNCRVAMEKARDEFGIPLVLSPENLSSPDLDELSGMTYISYFMMVDSPGYNATMKFVQEQIPELNVKNFKSDWNDGTALAAMTASYGEPIEGWPHNYPNNDHEGTCQKAINAGLKLGVNPVIPAKDICDPEVDHIGVMAYAAWFQHLKSVKQASLPPPIPAPVQETPLKSAPTPPPSPPPVVVSSPSPSPPPPPPPIVPLEEQLILDADMSNIKLNIPKIFQVSGLLDPTDSGKVRAEVKGPSSRLLVESHWSGDTCHCAFTPTECGQHQLVVYANNEPITGCPLSFYIPPDSSKVSLLDVEYEQIVNNTSRFKVDTTKAGSGKIRVDARSPSGRVQELSTSNNNGVFTANFTPSEVGEWVISILHEGENIKGSPFNVRVYDAGQVRVLGLEGATLGKQFTFQADTRGAGQGVLTADVTLNGRNVPTDVVNDGQGLYRITFTPVGAGTYIIRVHFSGMEVTGSPFTLEIVDASQVTVSGEGVSSVAVNRLSTFLVSTRGAGSGEVKVNITAPSGHAIPCRVIDNGNETHTVEYTPSEVGEYKIEVFFCGQPVGSGLIRVQAFDRNRILVKNLSTNGIVNQPVEFDIDATFAGSGNLEIMVNEGTVPCSVQNKGNRIFRASFVPREGIPHQVQLKFNGQEVPGSPWSVKMRDLSLVRVTGTGLHRVGVGKPTFLDINTGVISDAPLSVTVTSPSRQTVPTRVINNHNGTYRVEYTPVEIGNYLIDVRYADMPITNSPFTSKAYDCSAVSVSPIESGISGRPITFTIDVSRAGEGQLEIMVNRGTIPNNVRQLSKGVFEVTFTPRDTQTHVVDVKFNGENIQGCPIQVPIMDASKVTVQGGGIDRQVAVNKSSFFRVNTQSAGDADLSVRVTAPSGQQVPVRLHGSARSGYDAEYTLTEIGTHRIDVDFAGMAIPGSPFYVKTFDPDKVKVYDLNRGVVGKQSSFTVDASQAGEGNMQISIGSGGKNIQNKVRGLGHGKYEVLYTPQQGKVHYAEILYNNQHVAGSPFSFEVLDVGGVSASGSGLNDVPCNKMAVFTILAKNVIPSDLGVIVTGPDGRDTTVKVTNNGDGTWRAEWMPVVVGDHRISVTYAGVPIIGSPFTARAYDASKVRVYNIGPGKIAKPSYFNIDASRAGVGNLEIIVSVAGTHVPNFVKNEVNANFEVSFTPQVPETHIISVKFNDEVVPGSPFSCEIQDPGHVMFLGDGIMRLPINKSAVVTIDPRNTQNQYADACIVEIISPTDKITRAKVQPSEGKNNMWTARFTPLEVGAHLITACLGDIEIPGSPFACQVYDISKVKVHRKKQVMLGKPVEFDIDMREAGVGDLNVIMKALDERIHHKLLVKDKGLYKVHFNPTQPVRHLAYITFSRESIPGSPFSIDVVDSTRCVAKGRGLEACPVNQNASFSIDPSRSHYRADAHVRITSPSKKDVAYKMTGSYHTKWTVEFQPKELGVYDIDVLYGDTPVVGSPFKCYVYDIKKLKILRDDSMTGIDKDGVPGEDIVFYVDASEAGAGNLEVVVRCAKDGHRIPNYLESEGKNKFRVYFTPKKSCCRYEVFVTFNDELVSGSPFYCALVDGAKATASGDGLRLVPARVPAYFTVDVNGLGEADLDVDIASPSGRPVPARISGNHLTGYRVEYTPVETGRHRVSIHYADVDISGSPFLPEVYDAGAVKVQPVTSGFLSNPVTFEVDASAAGEGALQVNVHAGATVLHPEVRQKANGVYDVTFTPRDAQPHTVDVTFHGHQVIGSPFLVNIVDGAKVSVNWEVLRTPLLTSTNGSLILDPHGVPDAPVDVNLRGPDGRDVPSIVRKSGSLYRIDFTTGEPGTYTVDVLYGGQRVAGSPTTFQVFDLNLVAITDADYNGRVNDQLSFTVDSSRAGTGDVETEVVGGGAILPVYQQMVSTGKTRYTYTPSLVGEHRVTVRFNSCIVPGSPFTVYVTDPSRSLSISANSMRTARTDSIAWVVVNTHKMQLKTGDLHAVVRAPNGELVPAQILTQPDGDYKVEYSSKYTGKHMVEILYSGQAVMGSPFYVEIYDPNKIKVEGHRTGIVGQLHGFDLNRDEAGKAELGIRIISPSGRTVSYDIKQVQTGEHVSYMPDEDGVYKIYITYGGLEVPGCPLTQTINQAGIPAAHGDGLTTGEEGKPTVFHVDSKGMRGDLFVQVDAPNSIAKCNVVPEHDGTYTVTYTPVEVGVYTVLIKWNGREIPGSPFHPSIINPNKIIFPDGLLDSSNRMALTVSQRKEFQFDGRGAGRGTLTADVRGPHGEKVIEHVESHGNGLHTVSFTPPVEGNYRISLYWNGISLPRSPFSGYAQKQEQPADHSKVVLTGRGLKEAQMHEEAEFVIDGSQAGAGEPSVKLSSTKAEVNVQVVPLGGGRYRCTYVPTVSGAYLLYIKWSDSHVVGSPFKVNVGPLGDSRKVVCYGEGLKVGIMGKEIKSTIDTRRAGPGELTAFCEGPSQRSSAYCELTDHKDGTFTLHVRPQEAGRHVLHVKYGGEHVPGSPFVLRISGAPDASKVRVYGPGVEHGILATFQSTFFCETRGAGAGQLTVRIRGPKAAFRVEMQRESQKDRRIQCRYDPTEVGDYIIHVRWSGDNVPGSPFRVQIFDTREELEHFLSNNPGQKGSVHPNQPWNGEI